MSLAQIGIVVGGKGRGSNMLAIARACREGRIPAQVARVVAPRGGSPAVESAREMGLPVAIVPREPSGSEASQLLQALLGCDVVCLAGYLSLLPVEVLRAFPERVLNIHPALLPKFGGKGMYGMHVHEAVLASGDSESGCTVHLVSERYDEGPILVQKRCPVLPGDTPETLAARVLALEHEAYVEAIRLVLENDARRD